MKTALLIISLSISLFASNQLKLFYWNFETDKEFNKSTIDFEFMRESFIKNEHDIIILNNVPSPNLPPRFSAPYQIFKSTDTFYSDKKASYNLLLLSYKEKENLNVRVYTYPDKNQLFFKNIINGYIINNEKAIIVLNFEDNYENNLINLNYVIEHIANEEKIKKKNIILIGNIEIDKDNISKKIPDFKDVFEEKGTKLIQLKTRGQNKFGLTGGDVFISTNKIYVKPYLKLKEKLLDERYKGSKNTEKYFNKVSKYIPVQIIF